MTVFFVERCEAHVQIIYAGKKCLTLQSTCHPGADRPGGHWRWVGCPTVRFTRLSPTEGQGRARISPWISPSSQSPVVPASHGSHGVFLTHFHRKFCFPSLSPVSYFMGTNSVFSLPSIFDVHIHSVCVYIYI